MSMAMVAFGLCWNEVREARDKLMNVPQAINNAYQQGMMWIIVLLILDLLDQAHDHEGGSCLFGWLVW